MKLNSSVDESKKLPGEKVSIKRDIPKQKAEKQDSHAIIKKLSNEVIDLTHRVSMLEGIEKKMSRGLMHVYSSITTCFVYIYIYN